MITARIIIASMLFSYAWIGAMDHEAQQWKTVPNKQWQKKGNEKHKPIRNVGNESARENHTQGNDLLLHLWRKTNMMFNILNSMDQRLQNIDTKLNQLTKPQEQQESSISVEDPLLFSDNELKQNQPAWNEDDPDKLLAAMIESLYLPNNTK